jgi:hypothetical protein
MRDPNYSSEEMEIENDTGDWTVEKLNKLKDQFLAQRSVSKAISLLEELLGAKVGDIDE